MNFAEKILRRKHTEMYGPIGGQRNDASPSSHRHVSEELMPNDRQSAPRLAETVLQRSSLEGDVTLTRDGRIRRVRRNANANRNGSMGDINVDLDI